MGGWRIHLSYNSVKTLTESPEFIYVSSDVGFYSFHKVSGELRVYSKVDGFSDVLVRRIKYNDYNKSLFIAYENGNIDILKDGVITNIRDVMDANIVGLKQINSVTFKDELAYLGCSFGIVVVDTDKNEVKDSYVKLSENGDKDLAIHSVALYGEHIYGASPIGLIRAPLDGSNLSNFASWDHTFKPVTSHSDHLITFNGELYADLDSVLQVYDGNTWRNFSGIDKKLTKSLEVNHDKLVITTQAYNSNAGGVLLVDKDGSQRFQQENVANYGILDFQGNIWTGGDGTALVKYTPGGEWSSTKPNGPANNSSFNMAFYSSQLWVLAGGVTASWQPTFNSFGYYRFKDEEWINKGPEIDANGIYDMVSISGNTSSGDVWIGTQGAGVVHYKNGQLVDHFTDANSPLEKSAGGFLFTPGVNMDKDGNVWIANYDASKILKVRTRDNEWNSFDLGFGATRASEILIDDADNKWVVCPNQNDVGIIVMKELDGPLGSRFMSRKLTTGAKAGGLPSNVVRTIELDDEGEIWVGTDNGLAIFYNPTNIFEGGEDVDAKRRAIDDGNDIGYLLGSEVINDIKIDGANRKWIATNTGVWLVAEDGGAVIRHFTESNSPLLSNTVNCIGIDPRSGEVCFGTDMGIICYRSDASEGGDTHGDVLVYPNPIEEDYFGPLTVTGLPKDATVKITDVAGRMVYETIANGGTLVWDVQNFNGQRPATGVYLIFTANEDDEDALVSKVLILNK